MKSLLFVLALLGLTGCWSTTPPAPVIQIVTQYRLVIPDASLLKDCYSEDSGIPIFDAESYTRLDWADREKTLFEFIDKHLVVLELCNKQSAALRQWYVKQKKVYEQEARNEITKGKK